MRRFHCMPGTPMVTISLLAQVEHALAFDDIDQGYYEYGPTPLAFDALMCPTCGALQAADPGRVANLGRYDREGEVRPYRGPRPQNVGPSALGAWPIAREDA